MSRLPTAGAFLVLAGCAGASPRVAATTATPTPSAPAREPAAAPPPADPRHLPPDAQLGDLVAAAQALQAAGTGTSSSGCLLGRDREGFVLSADLAPALQSVPQAPSSLSTALASHASSARVLTTWGLLGDAGGDGIVVAAISSTPPVDAAAGAFVLVLLADGNAALRHTARALPGLDAVPDDAIAAKLLEHHRSGDVYVTAEAAVPLSRLYAVLAALPAEHRAVLAVALPAGSRLPVASDARANANPPSHACPDGLPAPALDAPEGDLAADDVRAALAPLIEGTAGCFELARGPAAAGGKLTLALRIGAEGRPTHACLVDHPIGDPQLGACIVEHARGLRFPRPTPAGFVDLHLPLALTPQGPRPQRAVCPYAAPRPTPRP